MSTSEPRRPIHRREFEIALICALPTESSAVTALFDGQWDGFGKNREDDNSYTTGWIGKHNVVLVHLPGMGKVAAATAGVHLRTSFPDVRLCLVVGVCGGVPTRTNSGDISLGDVLISTGIKQFDLARQYPDGLEKKESLDDNLGRPNSEIRAFLHLLRTKQGYRRLERDTAGFLQGLYATEEYSDLERPSPGEDKIYPPEYRHKHQDPVVCNICARCNGPSDHICRQARDSSCAELGCHGITRRRSSSQGRNLRDQDGARFLIHFGLFASGDVVMKSGVHRDSVANEHGVIGFEMEGAGVWDQIPTIIIKSVCDYADSHKSKIWQDYAATVAASCMKALLKHWSFTYDKAMPIAFSRAIESLEDQKKCLQSLAFPEIFTRKNKIRNAAPGTFNWLFRHRSYRSWLAKRRGLLWIRGKPGTGKSTLVNYAIGNQNNEQKDLVLASFFCDGTGVPFQRSPLGLFRSLLHQILSRVPHLLNEFTNNFKEKWSIIGEPGVKWNWELKELETFLKNTVMSSAKAPAIRIFVDALDECGEENAVYIASYFEDLASSCNPSMHNPSVLFSCRHYPNIRIYQDSDLVITLEDENDGDIRKYVEGHMKFAIPNENDAELVISNITRGAQGIFQWVALVVEIVLKLRRYKKNMDVILKRIRETPTDLHNLYQNIFQTIPDEDRAKALKLMQWVCFAARPLSLRELHVALVLDMNPVSTSIKECLDSSEKYELEEKKEEVKRLSGGLIEVQETEKIPRARFIHQSVFDYLLKSGLEQLGGSSMVVGNAHLQLSRSCLQYLTMEDVVVFAKSPKPRSSVGLNKTTTFQIAGRFNDTTWPTVRSGSPDLFDTPAAVQHTDPASDPRNPTRDERLQFFQYACTHWIAHAQKVEQEGLPQPDLLLLLQWPKVDLLQSWAKIADLWTRRVREHDITDDLNLLEIASRYGLTSVVEAIFQSSSAIPRTHNSLRKTALSYAVQAGHPAIVRLLLNVGKFDARNEDLFSALEDGYLDIAHMLLETNQIDLNSKNEKGWTSLTVAAKCGHGGLVQQLLLHGADVNFKDHFGITPLFRATQAGDDRMVQVLLSAARIEADLKDVYERTPLSLAAGEGHRKIVKLLLSAGNVKVDSKDVYGRTPLFWAAMHGYVAIVELLLSTGQANSKVQDKYGRTPLYWAYTNHHKSVVDRLVSWNEIRMSSGVCD